MADWTVQDLAIVEQAIEEDKKDKAQAMLTAIDYHNFTNQSSYNNKGAVDKVATTKLRQEAQKIYNRVFNLPDPSILTKEKSKPLMDLETQLQLKYEKKAD